MRDDMHQDVARGAENLLVGCGRLVAGDTVLIVQEPAGLGYYDDGLAPAIGATATALGLDVRHLEIGFSADADAPPPALVRAMQSAHLTVFLARIGDQIRFLDLPAGTRALVCYALDRAMLGSAFGTVPYQAMVDLRALVDTALSTASEIRVECPAGTRYGGRVARDGPEPTDTSTLRFPLSVFTPLPADGFSGQIAQRGFLVGTGSRYYTPYAAPIRGTLQVEIEGTEITGFDGTTEDVTTARAQYNRVADRFAIDGRYVHSWHAGLHPGCAFEHPAKAGFDRWSGGAFGNPRLLHLHTCGAYAPGEICLNLLDPTVRIDGAALYRSGRLDVGVLAGGRAVLPDWPALRPAWDDPARASRGGAAG